jgi:hypothetical protein
MTQNSSNLCVHLARLSALLLLCLGSAQSGAETLQPLYSQEMAAVLQEIQAMAKTDDNQANDFIVREATPSRIDRLFNMPEIVQQPKKIRENGLIFAGQGSLLNFEKPSDVIHKIAAWFPQELAAASASKEPDAFFGKISLFGPYPKWKKEAAAFIGLWNCMPQRAWKIPL